MFKFNLYCCLCNIACVDSPCHREVRSWLDSVNRCPYLLQAGEGDDHQQARHEDWYTQW